MAEFPGVVGVKYELWYEGQEERVGKADRADVSVEADAESVGISLREAVHARRRVRDLAHCSAANLRFFLDTSPEDELGDDTLLRFLLDGAPEKLRVVAPALSRPQGTPSQAPLVSLRSRSSHYTRLSSEYPAGPPLASTAPLSRRDSVASAKRDSDSIVVFVKTGDQTFPVEVESGAKVDAVKARIKEQEQIPLEQQRLIYAGIELEDGRSLGEYKVQQGSELQLVFTLGSSA